MTSTIEKRKSLHAALGAHKQEVDSLKQRINALESQANMGTAASMILHEINNLLTPVGTSADLALRYPEDRSLADKALHRAKENCERAAMVTQAVLGMTNGDCQEKEQVNLASLVEDVFACLCRDFAKDGIQIKKLIGDNLTVSVVPVKLQQVIMNLVLNAREALLSTGGGILTISGEDYDGFVKIQVSDSGCGMDKKIITQIFEPFFTTKAANSEGSCRSGSGLGLAFCKECIESHGGTISVESEPGAGSTFTITLPRC